MPSQAVPAVRPPVLLSFLALVFMSSTIAITQASSSPAATAFTYQGQLSLKNSGNGRVKSADVRFALFDSETGGAQIGAIPARQVRQARRERRALSVRADRRGRRVSRALMEPEAPRVPRVRLVRSVPPVRRAQSAQRARTVWLVHRVWLDQSVKREMSDPQASLGPRARPD